ncbi:MAG: acetylornithine transaminase [Propionibacteriaceae bacterium]|jgi:acetylornithine aminotransferase|nr:acetylornithine transaminase [Propionibacteriaceae bacterium]
MTSLTDLYDATLMRTFGTPQRIFTRGQGCYLFDDQGKRYLDLLAGIAVVAVGHANPQVTAAMSDQAAKLGHASNIFATEPQIRLAERLTGLLPAPARVFLTNSGTEANEAAFKLTRLTGRTKIVAAEGSFHGRTLGALAVTWTAKYRAPFEPLPGDVTFVPYGDAAALAAAVDDDTAAVVLEPIQGESGVIVPPADYLAAARQITAQHGALLWLDEVQTGLGRTGAWFAHTAADIVPDIITLAKALGNGFPIGACLAIGSTADFFTPGLHGTTFGGNPLASRVALATLDEIESVLPQVETTSAWLRDRLATLPGVSQVRGRGLMIGLQLEQPLAAEVQGAALQAGVVINAPRPAIIRLVPPLIVTPEDLTPFLGLWPSLYAQARNQAAA